MKIQFFAPVGALGGFTAPCGGGKVCLHATADLPARGVEIWMQASPLAHEQMPSEEAHKVFNDARRLIENSYDQLKLLKDLLPMIEGDSEEYDRFEVMAARVKAAIAKTEGGAV